jgi:FHIPEP family
MTAASSTVPVVVALAEPLSAVAAATVRRCIEDELSALLRELGLDLVPVVELHADPSPPRGHIIRVEVAGQPCRLPRTAVGEAFAYVEGTPMVADEPGAAAILDRLGGPGRGGTERLGELLGLACRVAVSAQPDVLLPGDPVAPALALGMSIAGRDAAALRESFRAGPVEPLIAELAAPAIGLIVEPEYFRMLTMDGNGGELFPFMRDGLFVELGFSLPRMHVEYDRSLRPAGFAFRFNAVRTLPRIGLDLETILVNDTTERLALMNVEGRPTVNPGTYQPAAIVAREHREFLEAAGLTVWDPFGYFILALASAIRRNAHALMTMTAADAMTEQLSRAFPAITDAASLFGIPGFLAPTLRELLRDRVSIRNLRRILELLVRGVTAPGETGTADPVSLVRSGLADQITHTLARQADTLVVYLLDPQIDDAIAGRGRGIAAGWSDETVTERLCDAVYAELTQLPRTASTPVVLTGAQLRSSIRARLRHEFPDLAVVSYDEIPDSFNIQPLARISWIS